MESINKKECFETFLEELLKWHKESTKSDDNDLSKLKVLKLLFLWVSKDKELLNIFNNFVSWELWPVEKDIYDDIINDELEYYKVTNNNLVLKIAKIKNTDKSKEIAKKILENLKKQNIDLIKFSASYLVDITHKWSCWKLTQSFWIDKISSDLILSEKGYFS